MIEQLENSMEMKYTLADKSDQEGKLDVTVECSNGSIYIMPKGYGDTASRDGDGCPLMVEIWEGKLRVVAWADINHEDPTNVIDLEGAREELRKEETYVNMSSSELDKLRRERIDVVWEEYDLCLDNGRSFAGSDGWETVQPGNEYWRTFYYYDNPEEKGPSSKATFTVQFKDGSLEIESAGPTYA